jgi:hypothetical protein
MNAKLPEKTKEKTITDVQRQNLFNIKDHYEAVPLEDDGLTSHKILQGSTQDILEAKPISSKPVPDDFENLPLITMSNEHSRKNLLTNNGMGNFKNKQDAYLPNEERSGIKTGIRRSSGQLEIKD